MYDATWIHWVLDIWYIPVSTINNSRSPTCCGAICRVQWPPASACCSHVFSITIASPLRSSMRVWQKHLRHRHWEPSIWDAGPKQCDPHNRVWGLKSGVSAEREWKNVLQFLTNRDPKPRVRCPGPPAPSCSQQCQGSGFLQTVTRRCADCADCRHRRYCLMQLCRPGHFFWGKSIYTLYPLWILYFVHRITRGEHICSVSRKVLLVVVTRAEERNALKIFNYLVRARTARSDEQNQL